MPSKRALALLCVLCLSSLPTARSLATTQGDIDAARDAVVRAQRSADDAKRRLDKAQRDEAETRRRIDALVARIERLERDRAELRAEVRERAVTAYKQGPTAAMAEVVEQLSDPGEHARRAVYLHEVMSSDTRNVRQLAALREDLGADKDALDAEHARLKRIREQVQAEGVKLQQALATATAELSRLQEEKAREDALAAARAARSSGKGSGADFPVDGLVCPVKGPVSFSNDFGDARYGGGYHTHKGTDIMASHGTPAVAITSGTVFKVGSNKLGGLRLWISGDNGIDYYYAHNSKNIASDGQHVAAGAVVALVGNSGDASGGPSHVHFEMHPGGGGPVNPYYVLSRIC